MNNVERQILEGYDKHIFEKEECERQIPGIIPPDKYQTGDIYVKLGLQNEAKSLEDKINKNPRHRKEILIHACDEYQERSKESIAEYVRSMQNLKNAMEKVEKLERPKYICVKNGNKHENVIEQMCMQESIKNSREKIKVLEKTAFDNYTRAVMLNLYTARLMCELENTENNMPSSEFRIMADSDQEI